MKKRGFSLMLCIALVFTMSASAFAADITEASTTVTKTVEAPPAQDVGSSVGPSNESSYEINIPASFSMDSADAVFNNIAGTTPDLFGAVKVSTVGAQTAAGTYTGKIYFNIQILNY